MVSKRSSAIKSLGSTDKILADFRFVLIIEFNEGLLLRSKLLHNAPQSNASLHQYKEFLSGSEEL